ncbi:MAG TPA: hypothetical protein IAC02_00490 [Candidatus Coprovivens excrementavium]|nr:hypothetical protein [Candidatus Coprovivens excrementavium]
MEIVYTFDGAPIIVNDINNRPENTTYIKPPDGLYEPIKFDEETQEWIGTEREIWLENLTKEQYTEITGEGYPE